MTLHPPPKKKKSKQQKAKLFFYNVQVAGMSILTV